MNLEMALKQSWQAVEDSFPTRMPALGDLLIFAFLKKLGSLIQGCSYAFDGRLATSKSSEPNLVIESRRSPGTAALVARIRFQPSDFSTVYDDFDVLDKAAKGSVFPMAVGNNGDGTFRTTELRIDEQTEFGYFVGGPLNRRTIPDCLDMLDVNHVSRSRFHLGYSYTLPHGKDLLKYRYQVILKA